MTTTDSELYRAFATRVRTTVATREGNPTMNQTAAVETTEPPAVPATFLAGPDAPCGRYTWCKETGAHVDHFSRLLSMPTSAGTPPILTAHLFADDTSQFPELNFDPGHDDWREFTSGDQLREQTARVRAHLARLDAFADQYDAIREADAQEVPAPSGCTWTITTENGVKVTGYRPPWAPGDPSEDGIPAGWLELHLDDLAHVRYFDGQTVNVDTSRGVGEDRYYGPAGILSAGIWCKPYSDDPAERVPVVNVELLDGGDDWIHGLDPDGVADLAAKLRAQADRLDNEVRPALIAARADWAKNGGAR